MFRTITITISDSAAEKPESKLDPEKQKKAAQVFAHMDKMFDHMGKMFDDMGRMFDAL